MQLLTREVESRGFFTLYLDDTPWLRLRSKIYLQQPLAVGQWIDPTAYEAALSDLEYPEALDRALKYLTPRARSEQEVVTRLEQAGYHAHAIARVMERLHAAHVLGDTQFAQDWADSRSTHGHGKYRILQDLQRKGIDRDTAEAALTHINMEEMETAAFTLATRLYGRMQGQADDVARRKVAQALARRGYEWDTIHRMIARLPERKQDDDDFPEE